MYRASNSRGMWRVLTLTAVVAIFFILGASAAHADAKKGKGTYAMLCFACHGANGEGNRALNSPALNRLSQWYMVSQLEKFKNGQRGAHPDDVTGAQMAPMASTLANQAAMADVSDYVRSLSSAESLPHEIEGSAVQGKATYTKVCVECHGDAGLGIEAKLSSTLAGQNDWYLLAQLKKFSAGIRGTAQGDTTGAEMKTISDKLTEEEMKDVIAYIATLDPPPVEQ